MRDSKKIISLLTGFRIRIFILLSAVIPLGFASKFYSGPGSFWFNNYCGGILYEIFWCLAVVFVFPTSSEFWIALWVFLITSLLEFTQLWHPHFLEVIRSTFIGRTLIGSSFVWMDFPYYIIGCFIGWIS